MAVARAPLAPAGREWSSGLFDCFQDCHICCLGLWCPCCLFGKNAEQVTNQPGCCPHCCTFCVLQGQGCICCVSGSMRRMMRGLFQLKEEPCPDFCLHYWCIPCALCQEARELEYRSKTSAPAGAYSVHASQQQATYPAPPFDAPQYGPGSARAVSPPASQRMSK